MKKLFTVIAAAVFFTGLYSCNEGKAANGPGDPTPADSVNATGTKSGKAVLDTFVPTEIILRDYASEGITVTNQRRCETFQADFYFYDSQKLCYTLKLRGSSCAIDSNDATSLSKAKQVHDALTLVGLRPEDIQVIAQGSEVIVIQPVPKVGNIQIMQTDQIAMYPPGKRVTYVRKGS